MINDIQQKIIQLKKQKDICILAHSYQAKEIVEKHLDRYRVDQEELLRTYPQYFAKE